MTFPQNSWSQGLEAEFSKTYMHELDAFLQSQKSKEVFPATDVRFSAYNLSPFTEIKVVILGQDPYHGEGQAHGLAFSILQGTLAPSLKNIYKELIDDIGCESPPNGDLTPWAKQGVLLLNTVLSVEKAMAGSHQKKGWEQFTDATIKLLSKEREHLVFILWGKPAQAKVKLIDSSKHLILQAPHPSPLSSYRGFFGSKPFSKTNDYLRSHNKKPINWCL